MIKTFCQPGQIFNGGKISPLLSPIYNGGGLDPGIITNLMRKHQSEFLWFKIYHIAIRFTRSKLVKIAQFFSIQGFNYRLISIFYFSGLSVTTMTASWIPIQSQFHFQS